MVKINMLLQQKSAQMGNNLAEQQVKNNNKAKTKQQTQEQLSSLSQVLKTCDFGDLRIVSLVLKLFRSIIDFHSHLYHVCRTLHQKSLLPPVDLCTSGT